MIKRIKIHYGNYQITLQYNKLGIPTKKGGIALYVHNSLNYKIDSHIQSGMIKTDISGHFAVSSLLKTNLELTKIKKTIIKTNINEDSTIYFKTIFQSTDWDLITQTSSANDSYDIFLERFIKIYDQAFPERKIKIKQKNLSSLWISKGLKKSSKRKQRLYETFFKKRSDKNYKT